MKIRKFNEEWFGGAPGKVTINIDGEGEVKKVVIRELQKMLGNIGGEIHVLVDGKEEEHLRYPNRARKEGM